MLKQNKNKALWDARKIIAQIVTDVVNLEDINYTVAEVQTLLDGITVGGHKIQDEIITLNQIEAWNFLFNNIEKESFEISKSFVLQLHNLVANREALAWGQFRDGMVTISGTDFIPPKPSELENLWKQLEFEIHKSLKRLDQFNPDSPSNIPEVIVYRTAVHLFAEMSRIQFFFDGNKRTARMMMSGILLSHGYPMINVPAKRKQEFNQIMINYYNNEQFEPLYQFMISCLQQWMIDEFKLENLSKHEH